MKTRSKIICTLILAASAAFLVNSSAQSYDDHYQEQLNRMVEQNNQNLRLRLERELAEPVRPTLQYFYSPAGQPLGYIQEERGQQHLYSNEGEWKGTFGR